MTRGDRRRSDRGADARRSDRRGPSATRPSSRARRTVRDVAAQPDVEDLDYDDTPTTKLPPIADRATAEDAPEADPVAELSSSDAGAAGADDLGQSQDADSVDDDHSSVRDRSAARAQRVRGRVARLAHRWRRLDPKATIGLAVVIAIVALTLSMPLRTYFSQRSEFAQLATANEQLEREVADYQQKVNLQNDPAYIEAQARARLHFVKPGEKPIVMMYPGDAEREAAEQRAAERARNAWYANLWDAVATPPEQ